MIGPNEANNDQEKHHKEKDNQEDRLKNCIPTMTGHQLCNIGPIGTKILKIFDIVSNADRNGGYDPDQQHGKDGQGMHAKIETNTNQKKDRKDGLHQIEQPKLHKEIAFEINRERSQVLKVFTLQRNTDTGQASKTIENTDQEGNKGQWHQILGCQVRTEASYIFRCSCCSTK